MCGILGVFANIPLRDLETRMRSGLGALRHRGPDDQGLETFAVVKGQLALGQTRLSIIDLSAGGHQPMHSLDGRYTIVFNGEIYNYRELRQELKALGHNFRTDSDTEVLLAHWAHWGVEGLLRLIGMFAFAVFDRVSQTLTLVRDAFGIKPLFYEQKKEELYFASELRPLLHLRQERIRPNLQRTYDYLVHGNYDSSEDSFIAGIKHLPPAHYLTFDLKTGKSAPPARWWKPDLTKTSELTFEQAAETLRTLFLDSVKLHLRSDVPLGFALSGGIDSSAVVSAVRYLEPDLPLNTFSYIADDAKISEEKWVDLLNNQMATKGHKVTANEHEMQADLDDMILKQGEPFGSTSIYAQYRVFKLAKESGVTVTLDGQGADELLAGYHGYPGYRMLSLIESKRWLAAHRFAKRWSQYRACSYAKAWLYLGRLKLPDWIYAMVRKRMGRDFQPPWLNTQYLEQQGVRFMEERILMHNENHGQRVKEALVNALMRRGLPSLLRHGDRNSMTFSIESRVPFLTLPLAEFLLSLPEHYLISEDGITKHVFREAMRGIVPDDHLDRKDKIGFETPESKWLLGMGNVIKDWIDQAPEIAFLNKDALLQELDEVLERKRAFDGRVWRWVNYLRWYTLMDMKSK